MTLLQNLLTAPDGSPIDGWVDIELVGSPFRAPTDSEVLGPVKDRPVVDGVWSVDLVPGQYIVTQRRAIGTSSRWVVQVPDADTAVWVGDVLVTVPTTPPASIPLTGIADATIDADGDLVLTLTDGAVLEAGHVVGTQGPPGPPPADATAASKGIVQLAGDLAGTADAPTVPALASKADTTAVIPLTQKGAASGVATLDVGGKIPQAQLPAVALTEFLGAVASQAAMLALTGQRGDWATRTDTGTDWQLLADDPTQLSSWRQMTYPASPVSSVAGRTGAVTLTSADLTDSTTTGRALVGAASAAAARAVTGAVLGTALSEARVLTQAAYDALATKDAATLYLIVG